MMTHEDKERDDALIAEALANTNNARSSWRDEMRVSMAEVLRLERSGWQPKPDRWTLAWDEATITFAKTDDEQAAIAVLRKHFPEAERPAVVVPMSAKMWAESRLNKRSAVPLNYGGIAAQYILNGAKGGE